MLYRSWQIAKQDMALQKALQEELSLPSLVCNVLAARKKTVEESREFVFGGTELSPYSLLQNIDSAVKRILLAVDKCERIIIFGDYDVDGVTATALLYTYLDGLGADVYYKLPSREDDGYGLNNEIIEQLASKRVGLIITVDNGVCANEAVSKASEHGIDVVITDHHLPPKELPSAIAIVNPCLPNDESPFKALSGVGVAFKLACALEGCEPEELLPFYADLVAIGTVADIMELSGENREYVREGLLLLQSPDRVGLRALIRHCGLEDKEITAETISFAIAPRLNAAGRMDSANIALQLLLSDDEDEADALALELCEKNAQRQKAEQDIADEIVNNIIANPDKYGEKIIVVEGEGFHQGVIGIVASRLVERFAKPAIVISIDENGEGKGSGRSVEGVSLYNAISSCKDLLLRFGGHSMAAGLSVVRENVAALRDKINAFAAFDTQPTQQSPLFIDAIVSLESLTTDDVSALSCLAPHGNGNNAPLFCIEGATVEAVYPISEGKHSRIRFKHKNASIYAVYFGVSPSALCYEQGSRVDVALYLSVYESKAGAMLSGRIKDIQPACIGNAYINDAMLYEMLRSGAVLDSAQKARLRALRADTATVYKLISQKPLCARDLRPVFVQLGLESTGKILVAICALTQLGLIELVNKNGAEYYIPVNVTEKKDLASAKIICALGE